MILSPERAPARGLDEHGDVPRGNLAPEGAVVKSTAIDPRVVDADGVYRKTGPARVFTTERAAIAAIKSRATTGCRPATSLVLVGRGPLGRRDGGDYQLTSALKYLELGKHVALLTDARFSRRVDRRVHRAHRPRSVGRRADRQTADGDRVRIVIDRNRLEGTHRSGGERAERRGLTAGQTRSWRGARIRGDLQRRPALPPATRLWAALQSGERRHVGRVRVRRRADTRGVRRGRRTKDEGRGTRDEGRGMRDATDVGRTFRSACYRRWLNSSSVFTPNFL